MKRNRVRLITNVPPFVDGEDRRDAITRVAANRIADYVKLRGGDASAERLTGEVWWAYGIVKYEVTTRKFEDEIDRLEKELADLRQANLSLMALVDREPHP